MDGKRCQLIFKHNRRSFYHFHNTISKKWLRYYSKHWEIHKERLQYQPVVILNAGKPISSTFYKSRYFIASFLIERKNLKRMLELSSILVNHIFIREEIANTSTSTDFDMRAYYCLKHGNSWPTKYFWKRCYYYVKGWEWRE